MNLLHYQFNYKRIPGIDSDSGKMKDFYYPYVPCVLSCRSKSTKPMEGLLDSGSDGVIISHRLADYLELNLERASPMKVVGSRIDRYSSIVSITIGRAGRFCDSIEDVKISITEADDPPIILGRDPIFKLFKIIFIEPEYRFELIPYSKSKT